MEFLRNEEGRWVHGYSLNLVICSIEEAELWAFVHGMRLAWETGSKRIQVAKTNCLVMMNWQRGIEEVNTSFASLIQECRYWMEKQCVVVI